MKWSVIYVLVPCDAHTIDESHINTTTTTTTTTIINNNNNNNNNALFTVQFVYVLCRKVGQLWMVMLIQVLVAYLVVQTWVQWPIILIG